MTCEDLVVACFLDDRAPLAVPELNRERTLKYLECCYNQGMSWKDVEQQIQDCLQERRVPREGILRQLKLARPPSALVRLGPVDIQTKSRSQTITAARLTIERKLRAVFS